MDDIPVGDIVGRAGSDRSWLVRRLPPVLAGGRFGLSAGAAAGLCLIALLAVIGGGFLLIHGQAHPVSLSASSGDSDSDSGADSGASSSYASRAHASAVAVPTPATGFSLEVDVVGKVKTSGVYHLPSGSRVADALAAAGGALPGVDLTSLDLASRVQDGDQIRVGLAGTTAAGSSSVVSGDASVTGGSAGSSAAGSSAAGSSAAGAQPSIGPDDPLDLNAATAAQLDELPGVGPATAAKIVAWRDAHGPFEAVSGLGQIPGFSTRRLATLTPLLHT